MATDCSDCCESLQCEVDALKANQLNLFGRTDDINTYLDSLVNLGLYRIVTSEAELTTALTQGGLIACTTFSLTDSAVISVDGTVLFSIPTQDDDKAEIDLPYIAADDRPVFIVSANDVQIINLDISRRFSAPSMAESTTMDKGIEIVDDPAINVDRLLIALCDIHHVAHGIWRSGDTFGAHLDARPADNITIRDSRIRDFTRFGMWLSTKCTNLRVLNNTIRGRDESQVHPTVGNGMWIGNGADYALIQGNEISSVGRHAIEYWNSQTDPETVGGNRDGKILNNIIHTPVKGMSYDTVGNFAISAFGSGTLLIQGNQVDGYWGIGYELYNDQVNTAKILLKGNTCEGHETKCVSCDNTVGATIEGNVFGQSANLVAAEYGIQIVHGAENLSIKNNEFTDVGACSIILEGEAMSITACSKSLIAGATFFTCSSNFPTAGNVWFTGKRIYVMDLNGDAAFNACEGYFEMTLRKVDGSAWNYGDPATPYFSIPVNSAAFPGVVPTSGILQQRYTVISVTNNKITHSYQKNSVYGPTYGIVGFEFQELVVKDNEIWYSDAVSVIGPINILNTRGNVYAEHQADGAATISPSPANIEGSNLIIPYGI
jgi:Right handed beta helix region